MLTSLDRSGNSGSRSKLCVEHPRGEVMEGKSIAKSRELGVPKARGRREHVRLMCTGTTEERLQTSCLSFELKSSQKA